jgi:1-acyl-sn-glycerol-3-phosphate acyltransferase
MKQQKNRRWTIFNYALVRRIWSTRVAGLKRIPLFLLKTILTLFGWLMTVEGEKKLPRGSGQVIFAANHNNYIETIFLPCLLMFLTGRKVSFFVHWMWKDFPLIGRLIRFIDPVWVWTLPVRFSFGRRLRSGGANSAVAAGVRRFREGTSLAIFPEGTRNHDPRFLLKGRRGLAEIALRTGAPVIPLGIDFPARMAKGMIPVIGKMVLSVGEPLSIEAERDAWNENEASGAADPGRRKASELVRRVTDKAMEAISVLCGKKYDPSRQDRSRVQYGGGHEA